MAPQDALVALRSCEAAACVREVVAPALAGDPRIRISVDGLFWECALEAPFDGWGRFRILPSCRARLIRAAEVWECERVPGPRVTLIMVQHGKGSWWGADVSRNRLVPVHLVDGIEVFDRVTAVWDGVRHWYLSPASASRWTADLRRALGLRIAPADLPAGIPSASRAVYAVAFEGTRAGSAMDLAARLEKALRLADATLISWAPTGGQRVRVTWQRRGHVHTGLVAQDDLTVQNAGICLSGRDRDFDLTSLVGVMEESRSRNAVHAHY